MENSKYSLQEENIEKIYDLKGSLVDRSTNKKLKKKYKQYIHLFEHEIANIDDNLFMNESFDNTMRSEMISERNKNIHEQDDDL